MNPAKLDTFISVYAVQLAKAHAQAPDEYLWRIETLPTVVERMKKAIENGSFNHEGNGFKWTCKELGIKHTRKAIQEYLREINS